MKSLMVKEKILFFDSINLYGDDFGDNGDVMLNVKVVSQVLSFHFPFSFSFLPFLPCPSLLANWRVSSHHDDHP